MSRVFTIINNKGGTGKTTTALNLGEALARRKNKVLLIDFDGQANLSSSLGIRDAELSIGDALINNAPLEKTIMKVGKINLIPSSDKLNEIEYQVNTEPGREFLLREMLQNLNGAFDYIIIDCAPNMGILSINSLVAADYYIVPMQAENFAFIGLDKIMEISSKVKKRLNPDLDLAGILIVRQAQKTKFSQAVISNIKLNDQIQNKLFKTIIRQDINLMESAAFGQSVFEYAPSSRGAEDYANFAKEIIKRYGKN